MFLPIGSKDEGAAEFLSRSSLRDRDMRVHLARSLCKGSRAEDQDGSGSVFRRYFRVGPEGNRARHSHLAGAAQMGR